MPESEFNEVVLELTNTYSRPFTFELVPPHYAVSGLTVNPLVKSLEAGRSTLVSIRYDSKFRDADYKMMQQIMAPETAETKNTGLVNFRNKRLEEKIKKDKLEKEQN